MLALCLSALTLAQNLTLLDNARPQWLSDDGIVMAGSWEPLLFRVRRDGSDGYKPTPQQLADYAREHSTEMVAELKDLGVNFVMMHCYKGAGLDFERQSMTDAVNFANLCHEAGLKVGVYNFSGAFLFEPFFKEVPESRDWIIRDAFGKPKPYTKPYNVGKKYRYYFDRNHPDAQNWYKQVVRFAVEDVKADLLHFDNYSRGPGTDENSVKRFRHYLKQNFSPDQLLEMGASDIQTVAPAMIAKPDNMLRRAWLDFSYQSLADSYYALNRYARTLKNDILIECNPGGLTSYLFQAVDHSRMLRGGEAFWDESLRSCLTEKGHLKTRIRSMKIGRLMNNMVFHYSPTLAEAAESMAFNLDCMGAICWFEYGKITNRPGFGEPVTEDIKKFVRFFHERREFLRNAEVIADVAILRNYDSWAFGDKKLPLLTYNVEQALIENARCFQIIYDQHLSDLRKYRLLVLAGCAAISDTQANQIKTFVKQGGHLCIIGQAGTHDKWMRKRETNPLQNLPANQVTRFPESTNYINAIDKSLPDQTPILKIEKDSTGLTAELTQQNNRYLLHLVNFRQNKPFINIETTITLPKNQTTKSITLISPEHKKDINLTFTQQKNHLTFTTPKIKTYELAIIKFN